MIPARGMRRPPQPVALHDRAMENLRFIRETMERSAEFTAVSGWAGVAMGVVAMGAAWLAWGQPEPTEWISIWAAAAAISFGFAWWCFFVEAAVPAQALLGAGSAVLGAGLVAYTFWAARKLREVAGEAR